MYLTKSLQKVEDKDFGLDYNCALQIIIFSDLRKITKEILYVWQKKKRSSY